MTHELKEIVETYRSARGDGSKTVLASVVATEGSTYRRPGVRMLITDEGKMTGAVSGGCVENEIRRQSKSVFDTGKPKMMTYDGRHRIGCEGILHILIERFDPDEPFLEAFERSVRVREPFTSRSYFATGSDPAEGMGTAFLFGEGEPLPVAAEFDLQAAQKEEGLSVFAREYAPCFRLMIIGAEHDAVKLCSMAYLLGWEVTVVAPLSDPRKAVHFPGADELLNETPETLDTSRIDGKTGVVLMTHNYVNDLKYLLALRESRPAYLGLLGPAQRRKELFNEFMEQQPDADMGFLKTVRGPAGLNIGAETPQEIAVSILSEILSVVRGQTPKPLKEKSGSIHSGTEW